MPATICCNSTRLAVVTVLTLFIAGCSDPETASDNATPGPATPGPATAAATTIATASAAGPMTGAELTWLEAISALHKSMDKVLQDAPSTLSSATMRPLAEKLAGCTRLLDALDLPSDRVRPVHDLAEKGCAQYEKAAKCFTTAAGLGVVVKGSAEDKKQTDAINCGFAAPGEGSRLLAEAEAMAFQLKDAVR